MALLKPRRIDTPKLPLKFASGERGAGPERLKGGHPSTNGAQDNGAQERIVGLASQQ